MLLWFFGLAFSQAQDHQSVDFISLNADIKIDPFKKMVSGHTTFKMKVFAKTDSVVIDGRFMDVSGGLVNSKQADVFSNDKYIWIKHKFKANKSYSIEFNYTAQPKKCMYFVGWDEMVNPQVWTQGQGKYTSNWLPSFDDTNEKLEFDLAITFLEDYEIIANGQLIKEKDLENGFTKSYFNMTQPMSSYLVAIAIGNYNSLREKSKSGIPLAYYYYPSDSTKVESSYRYSKLIFDFLEEEIGVPYPWQNYKQIPVHDFLYSGMENTGTTIFSDRFMIDSIEFKDKNYVNVNAHELAHQWFGDLVTATSSKHHWLQEGFATYYALLAEQKMFGEAYYDNMLLTYANNLIAQDKDGGSTKLLNPKSSSITFYQKGCWLLHRLRQEVGSESFKNAVKQYLEGFAFKNAESSDFISIIEEVSGKDLTSFFNTWLNTVNFPVEELQLGLTNSDVKYSHSITKDNVISITETDFENAGFYSKKKILSLIYALPTENQRKLIMYGMDLSDVKLRQEVAKQLSDSLLLDKQKTESLLLDPSYITKEVALYKLWQWYPDDRLKYLELTEGVQGNSTLNFRTLWLALTLATEEYNQNKAIENYQELLKYSGREYSFEIRQNAMEYLMMLRACNAYCVKNIEAASKHHNWRFKKFAEQLLIELNN